MRVRELKNLSTGRMSCKGSEPLHSKGFNKGLEDGLPAEDDFLEEIVFGW